MAAIGGVLAEIVFRIDHRALPLADISFAMGLERLRQRLQQLRHGAVAGSPKRNGDRKLVPALKINFARQRNVAVAGFAEFPVHLEIIHQIPPAVAGADIPDGSPRKPPAASHDQMHILAPGMEQAVAADFRTPAGVARPMTPQVRSQQRVEPQLAAQRLVQDFEFGVQEHHRAMRIGENVLDQAVAAAGFRIGQAVEDTIPFRVFDPVLQVALLLVAKRFAVADQELKIARVGLVHRRVVDFVDDAVAECEPDPATRMISGAETFLGAGGPTRFDAGRAKGHGVFRRIHFRKFRL